MSVESFIRDGVGEVRAETGYGRIKSIGDASGRNRMVTIDAEHLKDPVTGWLDTHDRPILNAVTMAFDNDRRVFYTVETHRRHSLKVEEVPLDTPLAELGNRQKVRDLIRLDVVDRDGRPLMVATANPDPDEAQPQPLPQPPSDTAEDEPPLADPESPPPAPGRRPRVAEGKPWEPANSDGSLNVGSYGVKASLSMVLLAHELLLDHADAPTPGQIRALARLLLVAADRAQAENRADGHSDRQDASHDRARSSVRAALLVHPVPFGATPEERDRWSDEVAKYASTILGAAVGLVET